MNTKLRNVSASPPDMSEDEVLEVAEVLRSAWITIGYKTKEFGKQITAYCGTDRVVCINSAIAYMEMILNDLGVGSRDEVISCAYTYTATASASYRWPVV